MRTMVSKAESESKPVPLSGRDRTFMYSLACILGYKSLYIATSCQDHFYSMSKSS